jgi:pimeloyl-ACP methyl ester carboxylesterase
LVADYVEDGFLHVGDSVELACSPRWEASNFLAHDHSVWQALASLEVPTTIFVPEQGAACRIGDPAAPIGPPPGVTVERIACTTHFLPMERPDLVQARLIQAIGGMS